MSRKRIDAHIHVFEENMAGFRDPYIDAEVLEFGKVKACDGSIVSLMPDFIKNSTFDHETMRTVLNVHEVSAGVILQYGTPYFNKAAIEAVKKCPDLFRGGMAPDLGSERCIDEMIENYKNGISVIKFTMHVDCGLMCPPRFPNLRFNDPKVLQLFEEAQKRGMTIAIDPGKISGNGYQTEILSEVVKRFPALRFVLCHCGSPQMKGSRYRNKWETFIELGRNDNVWFDCAAFPEIVGTEAYPYPTSAEILRYMMDHFGAEKIIWGSDAPGTLLLSSYRQLIDVYENSPLFSEAEKDQLFYKNAEAAYF